MNQQPALICGVSGQDGTYLAQSPLVMNDVVWGSYPVTTYSTAWAS